MPSSNNRVGFIGLGAMGFPMAQQLLKKLPAESSIYAFDVSKEAMDKFAEQDKDKVHLCTSSKEVAQHSDVIFSMVPEGSHVRSVYLTPDAGVLAADISGKLIIDMSTIDTATSLEISHKIASAFPTTSFYDAPVSGGVNGAEVASLTFMLGCAPSDPNLPRLRALLSLMGNPDAIFPCGGPSLGLTAKLCNNYCSGLIAIATSEAMNIGIRSGMDPRVLNAIFKTSTAQSAIADKFNPVPGLSPDAPPSRGYKGGFKVQLMRKDFGLAVQTAERVGARLALGRAGLETYTAAMEDERCRDLDSRVVYRYLGGVEDWEEQLKGLKEDT